MCYHYRVIEQFNSILEAHVCMFLGKNTLIKI